MSPVRALLALLVVTFAFGAADAAKPVLPAPKRTEHIQWRGGGTGVSTTRYLKGGAMFVTRNQHPDRSEVEVKLHVPTGPNTMIVAKFSATGEAGKQAHLPRATQRKVDALVRQLGEVKP